jgi:hypothetical protein
MREQSVPRVLRPAAPALAYVLSAGGREADHRPGLASRHAVWRQGCLSQHPGLRDPGAGPGDSRIACPRGDHRRMRQGRRRGRLRRPRSRVRRDGRPGRRYQCSDRCPGSGRRCRGHHDGAIVGHHGPDHQHPLRIRAATREGCPWTAQRFRAHLTGFTERSDRRPDVRTIRADRTTPWRSGGTRSSRYASPGTTWTSTSRSPAPGWPWSSIPGIASRPRRGRMITRSPRAPPRPGPPLSARTVTRRR